MTGLNVPDLNTIGSCPMSVFLSVNFPVNQLVIVCRSIWSFLPKMFRHMKGHDMANIELLFKLLNTCF